jgi:glutaredoxin 2
MEATLGTGIGPNCAVQLQAIKEQNPTTARQRSAKEKEQYLQSLPNRNKFQHAMTTLLRNRAIFQRALDLNPERSLDLNLDNLPTPEALAAFRDGEDGTRTNGSVSTPKFEKFFARTQRLVQQISTDGAGVSTFFICLRAMTRSHINS